MGKGEGKGGGGKADKVEWREEITEETKRKARKGKREDSNGREGGT